MTNKTMTINGTLIGKGCPTYVVAEISANHNQQLDRAINIIREAKKAGADAVKLQTYTKDTLTIDSKEKWFRVPSGSIWEGKYLYELYGEAYTPWEWHEKLFKVAKEEGLDCFSSPFDTTAVDFLQQLEVPAYKVASFEIVDLELLKKIGETGKPVIISTGMASLSEIEEAINTVRLAGSRSVALLKCTSVYPAPIDGINLRTIPHLADTFDVVSGLSDHTLGSSVSVASVGLGASIIEKHFTLDRIQEGPDSSFSMEPSEFGQMISEIREVDRALGTVSYQRTPEELGSLCFRRSLFVVEDIKRGDVFTTNNVRSIRPGYGLSPRYLNDVLGKTVSKDVKRGTPFSWDLMGGNY